MREARIIALNALKLVRVPEAEKRMKQHPHHLSGGMRQRVVIAIALCRSEEHTSELQSLMRISYAVFCLKKKKKTRIKHKTERLKHYKTNNNTKNTQEERPQLKSE